MEKPIEIRPVRSHDVNLWRGLLYPLVLLGTWLAWQRFGTYFWDKGFLVFALVMGLPLMLVVLLDLIPSILSVRRREHLMVLGRHGTLEERGHFRLPPYENNEVDRERYHRADREHEKVLFWLNHGKQGLYFLSGRSGTGKSSLLNAYVLPKLEEAPNSWLTLSLHAGADPLGDLARVLLEPGRFWERRPENCHDLSDLVRAAARANEGLPLLVVWDQFEEFLLASGADRSRIDGFERFIDEMIHEGPDNLRILIVFRTDYLHSLLSLNLPGIQADDNWLEISPFLPEHARDFLLGSRLGISPKLMDHILHDIYEIEETKGLVRPITLNMIGKVLEASSTGTWAQVSYEKGMHNLMTEYLMACLYTAGVRRRVPLLLKPLLTEDGTKRPRTIVELELDSGIPGEVVRGCLLTLGNYGLVRQLDKEQGLWEISHDFVAKQLDLILRKWRPHVLHRLRPRLIYGGLMAWGLCLFLGLPALRDSLQTRNLSALISVGGTISDDVDGISVRFEKNPRLESAAPYLARLSNLDRIDLSNTNVIDLRPLHGLENCRSLSLSGARNVDLDTLVPMTQLRELDLSYLPLERSNYLDRLVNLERLDLAGTQIVTLSQLGMLGDLRALSLRNTGVRSMKIEQVEVDFAEMSLDDLMRVKVTPKNVPFLTELVLFPKLSWLDLGSTLVDDLTPLDHLKQLRYLDLSETQVKDLVSLASLQGLSVLKLEHTDVEDISPLSHLENLTVLHLGDTKLHDLESLRGATELKRLDLKRTDVSDLTPLKESHRLEELNLSYTFVEDLTPITYLTEVKKLDLTGSSVTSVAWADFLGKLEDLVLAETEVTDLSPLRNALKLRRLDLSRTEIMDVSWLYELPELRVLILHDTKVREAQLRRLRESNPALTINRGAKFSLNE